MSQETASHSWSRLYIYPFIKQYQYVILLTWLGVLIVSFLFGPSFLSKTSSDVKLPNDLPSVEAMHVFDQNYPHASSWPPVILVYHLTSSPSSLVIASSQSSLSYGHVICNESYFITKTLHELLSVPLPSASSYSLATNTNGNAVDVSTLSSSYASSIASISGYYELIDIPDMRDLAYASLSANNQTLLTTVSFTKDATNKDVDDISHKLLQFGKDYSTPTMFVGVTGLFPLFNEMSEVTTSNFEMIDSTVIPVGLVIVGITVRSYRHMIILACSLICALLLAFALLVPITDVVAINPFSPTIMLSLGIAISFDYSLFQLNRFREEVVKHGKSVDEAVIIMMDTVGHVVAFSASILLINFCILICFPQQFLRSVGISCTVIVFCCALANLTLTPTMLLSLPFFNQFQMIPCISNEYVYGLYHKMWNRATLSIQSSIFPVVNNGTNKADDTNDVTKVSENNARKKDFISNGDAASNQDIGNKATLSNTNDDSVLPHDADNDDSKVSDGVSAHDNTIVPVTETDKDKSKTVIGNTDLISSPLIRKRNRWFKATYFVAKQRFLFLSISLVLTVLLLYQVFTMNTTSDNNLIYLRGSRSVRALEIMKQDYPIGAIDNYYIICDTGFSDGILTPAYFRIENDLIHFLIDSEAKHGFVGSQSFVGVSFCQDEDIDYEAYLELTNVSSSRYASSFGQSYRSSVLSLINDAYSVSLVRIETLVDPNGDSMAKFIDDVRSTMHSVHEKELINYNIDIEFYLFGAYTTTLDLMRLLDSMIPYAIVATLLLVMILMLIGFGGVIIAIRLSFTVGVSLAWTYGMMATIYQHGLGQRAFAKLTPSIESSAGVYWIIPIMSFSILVGLAMDYDIFLMSRVLEFRMMGWTDLASVCLATEKTGMIITSAGVIMAISFAGLLLPKTTVLNQYGFSLFFGVVVDTFFVRVILVPCIISFFADYNWWPKKMPPIALTPEQEFEALWSGFDSPADYLVRLEKNSKASKELPVGDVEIMLVPCDKVDSLLADIEANAVENDQMAQNNLAAKQLSSFPLSQEAI